MKVVIKQNNYFLKIAIFLIIMIIAGLVFRKIYFNGIKTREPINLVTTYNDSQGYHPKVISFKEKWNGYKYWMAFTPYPNKDATKENPVINASNNLLDWEEPIGIVNPLDIPEESDSLHYNSDTHLLYNNDLDQLELFWRYVDDEENTDTIYKMISKNGSDWTDKEIFLYSKDRKKMDYVSPAVIYENGKYKIWYVANKKVYYLEKDEYNITKPLELNITYKNNYKTWHLDVIYNDKKNIYEMVTCAYENVNNRNNMNIYYTSSTDNVKWDTPIVILQPSTDETKWDSAGLYRSSLLYENGRYYLFYSAFDKNNKVGIGVMSGKKINDLKAFS